jgi:hypothetical protein
MTRNGKEATSKSTMAESKEGTEALTENIAKDEVWYQALTLQASGNWTGHYTCSTTGCGHHCVAAWATNLKPQDLCYFCEECQQARCFGGWSEDVKNPSKCVATDTGNGIEKKATGPNAKVAWAWDTSVGKMPNDEKRADEPQEEGDVWDLVAIPNRKLQGVECSTASCRNKVVAAWASNKKPHEIWYCCAECQEQEFGCVPDDETPNGSSTSDDYDEEEVEDVGENETAENEEDTEEFKIVRCIPKSEQSETLCEICGEHPAVVTWASLKHPEDKWNYCEECTEVDFEDRVANILAGEEDGYDFCLGHDIGADGFILV